MNQEISPTNSKTQILLLVIALGIGTLIGILLNNHPEQASELGNNLVSSTGITDEESAANQTSMQNQINRLQTELDKEKSQRESMTLQITQLNQKLDKISVTALARKDNDADNNNRQTKTISTSARSQTKRSDDWIDATILIAAGVDESEADRIKTMYEDIEMQRLYLRDSATREGWIGQQRYRDELKELNSRSSSIRDELSEEAYDAYLYATNEPNRVVVRSALGNSPATKAGILPGDTLLKYNGERIYNWRDLRNATAKSESNAMINVTIERGGNTLDVFVPSGPLGVKLDHDSVNPT